MDNTLPIFGYHERGVYEPYYLYKEINVWGVNVLEKTIYIRMRNRVLTKPREKVYLMDIAQIIAPESTIPDLKKVIVHQVTPDDKNIIIIDVMKIIKSITD